MLAKCKNFDYFHFFSLFALFSKENKGKKASIRESLCSRNKFKCLIRESLCQKFREFWHSRNFLLAKVCTPKVKEKKKKKDLSGVVTHQLERRWLVSSQMSIFSLATCVHVFPVSCSISFEKRLVSPIYCVLRFSVRRWTRFWQFLLKNMLYDKT